MSSGERALLPHRSKVWVSCVVHLSEERREKD